MSHFSVLVIGDDVERALAPYHEFECTGLNDEFVQNIDRLAEARAEFETATATLIVERADGSRFNAFDYQGMYTKELRPFLQEDDLGRMTLQLPSGWSELRDEPAKDWESFADWASGWYGMAKIEGDAEPNTSGPHKYGWIRVIDDEVTEIIDRTNPNARWDWYQIGGRYAGRLIVRKGAAALRGDRSWTNEQEKITGYDSCLIRDLDLKAMLTARRAERDAAWGTNELHWWSDYREGMSREEFVGQAKTLTAFAVVKDGQWYERGKMGWFACVSNEKPQDDWDAELQTLLAGLPPETRITIVDCHI